MTIEAPARPISPVERVIAEMLLEKVGSSILDSGLYGRAWQHARAKYGLDGGLPNNTFDGFPKPTSDPTPDELDMVVEAMRASPEGSIDRYGMVSVDTFHWLTARLDYDPDLGRVFDEWCEQYNARRDRYDREYGLPLGQAFLDALWDVSHGIYPGEGGSAESWVNTYNHESALDRTLQFHLFHVEEDGGMLPEGSYVLLQIHGGADVRGGYTEPRLFVVNGEQADLFDDDRVEVMCKGKDNVLPEGTVAGQVGADGSVVEPVTVQHRWDNHYGDSHLRLTYSRKGDDVEWHDGGRDDSALAFADEFTEERGEPDEYARRNGVTSLAWSEMNDDGEWTCPFDGSPLFVGGAVVG